MKTRFIRRSCLAVPSLTMAVAALLLSAADACPFCNTETGKQVRAGIFASDFWTTFLVVASPFPVLLLAIAAYHFDWLKVGRHSETQPTPASTPSNPTAP